jgi:protease IV
MRSLLLLVVLIILSAGCRGRTLNTIMRGDMQMDGQIATVMRTDNTASRLVSVPIYGRHTSSSSGRVCIVDIDGLLINKNMSGIGSMGENPVALFREKLDAIEADPSIKAVVLRINSNGGGVTASDMMARDLHQILQRRGIPVVACIMEVGTGGAYFLAAGADRIVAQPTSIVGGIGVILNVYNLEDMMGQFGISPMPVKSGERIDMGSVMRPMQEAERGALQNLADKFHALFRQRVQDHRQLNSVELLDGRVMTGVEAHSAGLVDQVGYLDDAICLAAQLANLPNCPPLVMLRRNNDRAYTALDISPNTPTLSSILPIKVPGLDRSSLPTFLYMWQPEPTAQ